MPIVIPPLIVGIIEAAGLVAIAYETYDLSKSALESIEAFEASLDEAKKFVRERIEEIKKEIDANIDEKMELAFLVKMANADPQSKITKKAEGRGGSGKNPLIVAAIKQKIPFRQVISKICAAADKMPMITLRREKNSNIKPSDLLSKRKAAMEALLMLDDLTGLDAMQDVEGFITVRLKQLVASIMFEFMDEMLDWASPLKAEVCFGPAPKYLDPLLDGGTRLMRRGAIKKINPFFPPPRRGDKNNKAIVADLVIPDYRKQPTSKTNIFAIVEIKFPNDTIENEQFKNYEFFSDQAAKAKTEFITLAKTKNGLPVSKGCHIALFRYAEDVAATSKDDKKPAPEDDKKPTSKPTSKKPGRRGGH
jgi:hypothetical protein